MKLINTVRHRRDFDNTLFHKVCAVRSDGLNYMTRLQPIILLEVMRDTRNQCLREYGTNLERHHITGLYKSPMMKLKML